MNLLSTVDLHIWGFLIRTNEISTANSLLTDDFDALVIPNLEKLPNVEYPEKTNT